MISAVYILGMCRSAQPECQNRQSVSRFLLLKLGTLPIVFASAQGLAMSELSLPSTESAPPIRPHSPEWARQDSRLSEAFRSTHAAISRYAARRSRSIREPSAFASQEMAVLISDLRRELSVLVRLLEVRQTPPERVVVLVKDLLVQVDHADHTARLETEREIITWTIEDYFSEPSQRP